MIEQFYNHFCSTISPKIKWTIYWKCCDCEFAEIKLNITIYKHNLAKTFERYIIASMGKCIVKQAHRPYYLARIDAKIRF